MVLDRKINELLKEYISICAKLIPKFSEEEFLKQLKICQVEEFSTDNEVVAANEYVAKWYKSLKKGKPDYSLYSDFYYSYAGWLSYRFWSRRYVKLIRDKKDLFGKVSNIIDFGNGIGYSTLAFAEIFKNAKVYGTNFSKSLQFEIAKEICKDNKNIQMVDGLDCFGEIEPKTCDIAFCSEYFEHFENPVEHLIDIYERYKPKFFVVANSFNTLAVGHFNDSFVHQGNKMTSKEIGRLFGKTLKEYGYKAINHGGWNNRPQIYKLEKN